MSIVYSTTLKNTRLGDVVAAIDGGGGPGKLEIGTSAFGTLLSTITFSGTCGTVSGGILTFSGTPLTDPTAASSGTAAAARIKDFANTIWVSGLTVGTASTDIILSSATIVAGQPVTLTSATITHG